LDGLGVSLGASLKEAGRESRQAQFLKEVTGDGEGGP